MQMMPRVILLHGLGRTARSMSKLATALEAAGYETVNIDYPSRQHGIEWLCAHCLAPRIDELAADRPIHVVSHSLGGILIRQYLQQHELPSGSRIVMLAPPNHGSEVADHLRHWKPFQWLLGPCLQQLGTGDHSFVRQLLPAKATAHIGIITGNRSVYPPLSWWIDGENDGLVSVASANLENRADFLVVRAGHGFIMRNPQVIRQTIHFLCDARFR